MARVNKELWTDTEFSFKHNLSLIELIFFSVRLLSVLRSHSVFSSPPQRTMTSDFEGFSIPDFIHYIYFPILILEKEPVFSLLITVDNFTNKN